MSQFAVNILADSISDDGHRLVTMSLKYPRFIHAEILTHRVWSRNAASSRAIPTHKLIAMVKSDPVMPIHWGRNQPGMQADSELDEATATIIQSEWSSLANHVATVAESWSARGLHKQAVNRVLEPFLPISVIVTATDWDNFFTQRCHPAAQPEMRRLAEMMRSQMSLSRSIQVSSDEWHLPFVTDMDREEVSHDNDVLIKLSVARCARVSYNNHEGRRDVADDLRLYDKLVDGGHYSPFEHVAQPRAGRWANFSGWQSFRNIIGY